MARPRLFELLDSGADAPVSTVIGPAGSGKSILVSQWIERQKGPVAWLSLGSEDSDLRRFLELLLGAIEDASPELRSVPRELPRSVDLPPVRELAALVNGALEVSGGRFTLVLDDYHAISPESPVHGLMEHILRHPPSGLHVVLATRHDPPLPVAALWGGTGVSVRINDLRFRPEEAAALLHEASGCALSEPALAYLDEQLEGWAVGLRLLSHELRHAEDPDRYVLDLRGGVPYVQEYLLQEVFAHQTPKAQALLARSSLFDRFCAPLLAATCGDEGSAVGDAEAHEFVERLQTCNLLAVSLDDQRLWFRYHQLFREFLRARLEAQSSQTTLERIHGAASEWFEAQGMLRESVDHAVAARRFERAADIVGRHRHAVLDQMGWQALERWLDQLPEDLTQRRTDLLVARALAKWGQWRLRDVLRLVEKAEAHAGTDAQDETVTADLDVLRGGLHLWLDCDGHAAKGRLDPENRRGSRASEMANAWAELYLAVANVLVGEANAVELYSSVIEDVPERRRDLRARMHTRLALVQLLEGRLSGARTSASKAIELLGEDAIPDAETWAHYLRANAAFQELRLEDATADFEAALRKPYALNARVTFDGIAGLALSLELSGRSDQADGALRRLVEYAHDIAHPFGTPISESLGARLALLRGEVRPALRWAERSAPDPHPRGAFFVLDFPALTQVRAWVASGTTTSLGTALERLRLLRTAFEEIHVAPQLLEVLVLQADALHRLGDEDESERALDRALSLAEPRGFVRPFVESGAPMAELLQRKRGLVRDRGFLDRLLGAIEGQPTVVATPAETPSPDAVLPDPLTPREIDVLELLSKRLRDKEIAAELAISPITVNGHLKRIYRKLDARNRREAVDRATRLKILRHINDPLL